MTNSDAARPHSRPEAPWVKSSNAAIHAAGGQPLPPHQVLDLRLDRGLIIAAIVLSLLLCRPDSLRTSLGRKGEPAGLASVADAASRTQHYGLRVSPYKAAILETLEDVTEGASAADAEWQTFVLQLSVQLRRLRLAAGLSQEEVASRAGLSRFIYRQYESGESRRGTAANPALRSILSIAQVLQVPIEDLLPKPVPDLRSR
ncbi:helix-turn-helix transcriptional regulator [Microbacterium sp. NPDC089320]|uniref:helix-turn-helix transcriptional regulator n=1 Tax=Microbacterium sp. NPDC089320 TaxID=3155182 RepID=UPI00341D7118